MNEIRADIQNTGVNEIRSCSIKINKPANEIFKIIATPALHAVIDGSKTVQGLNWGPDRLSLNAKFGMKMKIGVPYKITNIVTEYREDEVIAWRHLGRWVWRYELKALSPNETLVTESFDARPSHLKWWLKMRNAYQIAEKMMAKTLVRLKSYAETGSNN